VKSKFSLLLVAALLGFSIASISSWSTARRTAGSLPPRHGGEMRCVGYIPAGAVAVIDGLDWSALTHVNVAFCNPDSLGVMQNPFRHDPADFQRLVSMAHANGVKVIASLGGGGGSRHYPRLISTAEGRTALCEALVAYARKYDLDGLDLDLEERASHPFWGDYEPWVVELREHCTREGLLLTTAVSTWFSDRVTDRVFRCFDFVNIMAYDGPFEAHSTYEMARKMAAHYHRTRGIDPADIVIGVPFYGRIRGLTWGDPQTSRTYKQVVADDPAAWKKDYSGDVGFNGAKTMKRKARMARRYGGIMIWQLAQDTQDERSLLRVIKENLNK
jgi:GH18 family chitinase